MTNFKALNDLFDHIYIVTLKRATDRQLAIQKNLAGLNYEFFWGADKNDFSIPDLISKGIYDDVAAKKHHRYGKALNGGQIGCAWSHKKIYEDILINNYKKVLILEDDVFADDYISALDNKFIQAFPQNWDLIYFDYNKNVKPHLVKKYWYHVQHFLGLLKWDHTMIQNIYPKKVTEHIYTAGFHDYTSAYALSGNGAKELLKMQTPIAYLADNLLSIAATKKRISAFIIKPRLFHQSSQSGESSTTSFVDE